MIGGSRVAAIIPARGGSKSVPLKNIRPLGDKPLLAWTVETARAVEAIDRVLVSTDHERIAEVARRYGAEVAPRPAHLATDEALVIDTVRDLLAELEDDGIGVIVLLEPTCPFRSPGDVTACLSLLAEHGYDSVATFCNAKLHPHRAWRLHAAQPAPFVAGAVPWTPRQQLPAAFQLNGAVYACSVASFPETGVTMLYGRMGAVVTPPERSFDIDSEFDLRVANYLAGTLAAESG